MIVFLIIYTTFFLVVLQLFNEHLKSLDSAKSEGVMRRKSDSIHQETKKLLGFQKEALIKADRLDSTYEKLVGKYEKISERQAKANTLQEALNDFVTGGFNKPRISVFPPMPLLPVQGTENRPKEYQKFYKSLSFTVNNFGQHPIHDVSIIMFGSLGLDLNANGTSKDASHSKPYSITWGPHEVLPGKPAVFHTAYYDAMQSGAGNTMFVMWKGGFYTMIARWEYRHPKAPEVFLREVKYLVGNQEVVDVEGFFDTGNKLE